jgi:hypothetical protein
MRSMVSGLSSRTPSTSPPRATTDMTRAMPRALVWPLAAPMSAPRQPGVLASSPAGAGPVNVLKAGLFVSISDLSIGYGGGGTTSAIRPQSLSTAPIWKSAPSGPAISSATNCLSDFPLTRRTTSPIRWPKLSAW